MCSCIFWATRRRALETRRANIPSPHRRKRARSGLRCAPLTVAKIKEFRQIRLPLPDQGVTLAVRYDRNSPAKPPSRLCPRQHLRPDAQLEQLRGAGCAKIYREKVTGAHSDRRELLKMLKALTPGDVVTVTRIDRAKAQGKQMGRPPALNIGATERGHQTPRARRYTAKNWRTATMWAYRRSVERHAINNLGPYAG